MRIVTHPDNLELIKGLCERDSFGAAGLWPAEICTNAHLERRRRTGRYVLPGGRVVPREQVRVAEGRYVEWGSSDAELRYLLARGVIREETEALFYVLREDFLERLVREPLPLVSSPRYVLMGNTF